MEDPYDILGLKRGASDDAIRAAYRKLAKRHHPDLNPGKPEALERFKAINAANDLLSDPEKRGRFDRGEIDASGNQKAPERPTYRDPTGGGGGGRYSGGIDPEDLADLFSQGFGNRARGFNQAGMNARGPDVQYSLTVGFLEAVNGAVRRLSLPDGSTLDLTIPAGLRDGHTLRLKGKGRAGMGTGPAGDALVEVSVAPHPVFQLVGDDIHVELPVTLREAVLGASVEVPTVKGIVRLSIPPRSGTGTKLRLKGRGLGGGSQVVELKVVLPTEPEPALAAFLQDWKPEHPSDPRAALYAEAVDETVRG